MNGGKQLYLLSLGMAVCTFLLDYMPTKRPSAATITTGSFGLYRRTSYISVRAKDAAVSRQWFQNDLAFFTFVKPRTRIGGHPFFLAVMTLRTGNG
jgi:hypothetical protein